MYLSLFWQQQSQFQQSCATSSEPWTPNQTLLKIYWIKITYIHWHCSGEFLHWPCPMLPRNWSMPLGMIILFGNMSIKLTDCWSSGESIVTHTYVEWSQQSCQTSHVHRGTEFWIPNYLEAVRFHLCKVTWHMALRSIATGVLSLSICKANLIPQYTRW